MGLTAFSVDEWAGDRLTTRVELVELRLSASMWLTEVVGVEVQVPARLTGGESPHAQGGVADAWVLGRARWRTRALALTGRVGTTVPVGAWREAEGGGHQHGAAHAQVHFGTGTVQPLAIVDAFFGTPRWQGLVYAQAVLGLLDNPERYRPGTRLAVGVEGRRAVPGGARLTLSVDVVHETPELLAGVPEEPGSLGRTELLVGGGLVLPVNDAWLTLSVKVPVLQQAWAAPGTSPGRVSYPALLTLGVQSSTALWRTR